MNDNPIRLGIPERDAPRPRWFALLRLLLALPGAFLLLPGFLFVSAIAWAGALSTVLGGRQPGWTRDTLNSVVGLLGRVGAYLFGLTDTIAKMDEGSARVHVEVPDRSSRILAALLVLSPLVPVGSLLLLGGALGDDYGVAVTGLALGGIGALKLLLVLPQVVVVIWFGGLLIGYGALAALLLLTFGRRLPPRLERLITGWLTWSLWTLAWFYGLVDVYPLPSRGSPGSRTDVESKEDLAAVRHGSRRTGDRSGDGLAPRGGGRPSNDTSSTRPRGPHGR